MDARSLVIFLVIGVVAGFLASLVVGGGRLGIIGYLVSGVIGSFVGGYLFTALRVNLGVRSPILNQIITATVGAIIVVIIARLIG
ncbi:MAG: GlsB/YeaQ/YmgE family stress response membrane protein [Devosia sp.]|uniref:GlsB/YeaQ/YmgE family stress response membrane protein n=1 Tax=Devosia sp. TaxID=1871048 RepID=UPI001AC30964|nr:GlsB/YeaQ/YmgE family stress response membrane protein [Devosia sp.]MBN9314512.1 GlsB/YeaQ/YmgE family stress response membrane protein [Devosia sp.]